MEVRLLACLLLVCLPGHNASWLSFEQEKIDGENQHFFNPQSISEELGNYVSNGNVDGGTRKDISLGKRSVNKPGTVFDALEENLGLPDEDQRNVITEVSQASKDVPSDSVRHISDLMLEEIGEIEKNFALQFSKMLPLDEILPDSQAPMLENYDTENLNEIKEDEYYGSGEVNTQEEKDDVVSYESSTTDSEKDFAENPSFQQSKEEVEFKNEYAKNARTRSGIKEKATNHVTKSTIKRNNQSPSHGIGDDDDLDSPVVFPKEQHYNKPVHSEKTSSSSGELEELGNLVVVTKLRKDNEENRRSRTFKEFTIKKDNVSNLFDHSEKEIKSSAKLDLNKSSQNGTYSTLYSTLQIDNKFKQERSKTEKYQDSLDKPNERSKRSKYTKDNKKHHDKSSFDDEDDDIRIKKSGIFENIANAFAHIDKTKKENERVEKRKKSTLEEIHETNQIQPVNGGFTSWTDWSECSETCGKDSVKMRMRVCTNPPPANGGKDCQGWRFEVKYCKLPSCKERQGKVSESKVKAGFKSQRKEIAREDIQQPYSTNASLGQEGTNKTAKNLKQQRSQANRIIEAMFKDVIHKAFVKSKDSKVNATKESTNETKRAPIKIHTDSGLIASENEVDTIDDAPDTSEKMETEGQENMESEGQANPSPQDMETQNQDIQSSHEMEYEGKKNPTNMESVGEVSPSPQDMELNGQENQQTSQDAPSQDQENSSAQEMEFEEDSKSLQKEETSQESDSTQSTNVKQFEESQSSQDTNVKQSEKVQSSQDTNVKQSEKSQSSQHSNAKQSKDSQSPQDTNVKQSKDRQSLQDTNVKQSEKVQSSQDTNVKQSEKSQSSQHTNAKQSKDSQSPQDTNVKQSKDSQSLQESNVKQSEKVQSSQDKQSEGSQSSQDTNGKQSKDGQSLQESNVKQSEKVQSSQDKQSEGSQSPRDTNVKQSKDGQSLQDTNVKQSEKVQSSQDKQSEGSQSPQDTNGKQSEKVQSSQDKQSEGSQSPQDTNGKQSEKVQSSQDKQSEGIQSSQDTNGKQSERVQSSQDKKSEGSQSSQDSNGKQSEKVQSSQDKQSEGSQSAQSARSGQERSSKKGKQKVIYDSIDGNFDMVMKADEKDQNENEKAEIDITKVATEILKHNDTDAILKALSDNDTDKLDSYTDGDASNAKNHETQNKPHYYFLTSNHSKVSNNSAIEKGQDNHHATEKDEKHQEHGIHGNQTAGNHSNADVSSLYEHAKQALSNDTGKNKNDSSSNIKESSHDEDKESNKSASSGANDEKNKGGEALDHSKDESKQDTTLDQEEVDSTIKKQGEKHEINNFSSDQESLNDNRQKNREVTSIDWGNLHALNALVEILAEHETNGTQNDTYTNQPQNDTTPTKNNAAVIVKKAKNGDVNTITQGAQPNKTKATSHSTHDNDNAPFAGKDKTTMNINDDDYTKHDGGKRQNVTGEGNARSKANLTMPENPNGGQSAPELNDTSKNKKDTSADKTQGKMKKKKNATTEQESLFDLLKDVVLSLHDANDSTITTNLDELDKVINTTTKLNHKNNDKTFTSWTEWTTCSKSCGEGTKTRMRKCLLDRKDCKGPLNQTESCHGDNCTVDGGFTEWSVWSSACSAKCGEGVSKIRSRTCTNPAAQFGGKPCEGALTEQQDCKLKSCVGFEIAGKIGSQTILPQIETQKVVKEKGLWGPWSAWSTCTATCGGEGYSSRERSCLPGKQCAGPRYDTKQCGTEPCPMDGGYTSWTAWSPCTPSCGLRAYRMRTRNCTNPPPSHGGRKCYDSALETEPCMIVHCPIDGGYSPWSSWSPCTKTCGSSSLSQRERACTSPEPRYGGRPCQGDSVQKRECGKQPCPVNGDFSDWSSWTPCANVSCGSNLFSMRNRTCDNPRPKFGGENCTGHLVEKKSCRLKHCPINGGFSSWSQWSECPKNCKVSGVSHRRRRCDNPKPRHGGRDCVGQKIETKACSNTCPVDGGFTEWTSWSKCSQECGRTSIKSRERYCTNPSPANGGKKCKGSKFQVKICRSDGCPVNGNYTTWSDWTVCPRCGFGVQTRQRTCTNPSPINGGKDCAGPAKETLACPFKRCRDNGFGQWSSYGHCSKSCGGGAKMRRRTCEDEFKGCDGKFVQLKPCNQHSCVLGHDHLIDVNPVSLCGFNPCQISRCLGYPQAKCLTSSGCWPVFFDKRGNILESCKGDKTVFTSSPEMICHSDPCKVSGCYTDEAANCHVSIRCKPVFLDSGGNKLDCRGLLKVPPVALCGADPCEGSSCDLDRNARCVADYNCNPVFISTENEILSKCKVSKYRDNDYIINSKAGKKKTIELNQDMENMKSQMQAFLRNGRGNNERVETIAEYHSRYNPSFTADQQDDLEYKLQHLKKRNRFYKPKKKL